MVLLESGTMARPPSGLPERTYFRRSPAWCAEMTALAQQCADIIEARHLYFPYRIGKAELNTSGIVQGTLEQMASAVKTIKPDQWAAFLNDFAKMDFMGDRKGLHFEQTAYDAFQIIGAALELQRRPDGVKLTWKGEYHYPLIIAVDLLWFVSAHTV